MTDPQTPAMPRLTAADDLYRFNTPGDPQIAPDGRRVVFTVQRVERETEKKYTNLWLAEADGTRLRQFTHGKWADTQPRWSPDGQTIAFVSNRGNEEQAQIYLIPIDGGEARPLTELKGNFASFEWSPDGAQLVCQFRRKDADALEREKDETKKKLGISYRHITSADYKFDGAGYLPRERWHVWVIDAANGAATQLTEGDKDETEPRWSPDGQQILFASNRAERPDMDFDATELYLIPAAGGEMRQLETHPGRKFAAVFSPDGTHVAYLGRAEFGRWYQNARLYVAPVAGGGARELSGAIDLHLAPATNGDFFNGTAPSLPVWSADGRRVYCLATTRANEWLLSLAVFEPNDEPLWLVNEPGVLGGYTFDRERRRVAYLWSTLDDPVQLLVRDAGQDGRPGEPRPLTTLNPWLAEIATGDIEEVWFKAADGYDLHGWILKPPGFDPAQQYPSILQIHGGPQTQYGNIYMHEFHYLAAAGYVVYWSNPRGSQGYGEAMTGAIYGRWGTVDYDDVMAWADYAARLPYIDTDRMGVTGGSYGGYMTTLIIGRTDRFRAAVAQRVVSNFLSFYGSSDLNYGLEHLAGAPMPWDDMATCWAQSPISAINNATTPTLVIHSENDYRCDQEQGEQVFVALRRLGVDTELLLLPGESHGVSRGGRTDRRIARLEHMLGWFERYLK
ncbi:Acylaminoacyl-peptidase YuxL [Candidatus Promineifilum breve]|uniref:Acylaminoacyl-peptidase YuxL n=1 Tax=Candidatus Promineifilum breve TaxID=1806508 RepID=A0A160T4C6_9CHLR|nr:S9 family peptidase [Candidatus Promineifilum breve]CUS03460.2 Acylaminoacyl-peptidase YuxL [Candidatus Promineifilum breve]